MNRKNFLKKSIVAGLSLFVFCSAQAQKTPDSDIWLDNKTFCRQIDWEDFDDCMAWENSQEVPPKPDNNEAYCEDIYWEDYDNCVDWHNPDLVVSKKFCENLFWPSTKKRCFEELEKASQKK